MSDMARPGADEGGRVANLLGALAVALTDRVQDAAHEVVAQGGETPAAIVALGHAPGLSNDQLARALRLSHPGTVRLADRLVAEGLVRRDKAQHDRRAVSLSLTEAGEARRRRLLAGRAEAIGPVLAAIGAEERAALGDLLAKLLATLPRDALEGLAICRYCDEGACAPCPVDAGIARREESAGG